MKTMLHNGKMTIVDFEGWIYNAWPIHTETGKPIVPRDCTRVDNDGRDCIDQDDSMSTWCPSCCVYHDLTGDFYTIFPDY
jgi:hypothetical protein